MEERDTRKPSGERRSAPGGPTPAGRSCHSRRAEQGRKQGPARPRAPESARPDQGTTTPPSNTDAGTPGNVEPSTDPTLSDAAGTPKPKQPKALNLDQKGAMALAKRLEIYWHDLGFPSARFWAEPIGERFEKIGTYEIYRVASNLVNGLPPRYLDR